jgi:5-methylcytosine-specific restriction endonuclease McrA
MSLRSSQREKLYERDGRRCAYCGIDESDFLTIWGPFYGGARGRVLEIDRKENQDSHTLSSCVLACAICNNAKSDKFSYDEFKIIGKKIGEVWRRRKSSKGESEKLRRDLIEGYRAAAADNDREKEALEWAEGTLQEWPE